MKESENNRGNVILLTVIAIATMVIVVVGATFAYLASSVQDSDTSNINVNTEGSSDLFLIDTGADIQLLATLENFGDGDGNLSNSSYSSVTLQTSSLEEVTYKYKAYLEIPDNNFDYTSGVCYTKGESIAIPTIEDQESCKLDNATNAWATADGTTYGCYAGLARVEDTFFTNEVACLSKGGIYLWEKYLYSELVMDLYRNDPALTDETACVAQGKCYDPYRNIVSAATNSTTCTGENTWVSNTWENDKCYAVIDSKDLTTVKTVSPGIYELFTDMPISATNGGITHNYKTTITFVNFGHNQIINGNKSFTGMLTFERIIPGP